ncbi:MAG: helix-turn-helix transcriptional regulator, partial [Eubacterium sp.]|nr:helix-turn-helix transcriptional regulator [Eubacterium sp.]
MMNQIKIGTFICERRKAKGWTQRQLAEKLEITDKAISKWETGRSMPDLSLFMPLCTLLDVTLNELFAGECIAEEKLKEKADEVLMDVITNWLGHDK